MTDRALFVGFLQLTNSCASERLFDVQFFSAATGSTTPRQTIISHKVTRIHGGRKKMEMLIGDVLTRLLAGCSRGDRELIMQAACNARDISARRMLEVLPDKDPHEWPVVLFWAGLAAAAAAVSAQSPLTDADLAELSALGDSDDIGDESR